MKKLFLVAVLVLLLLGIIAQAQTELPEPGILPDSPWYGLKKAWEAVGNALTFGEEAKVERALKLAERRLSEAQAIAEKGRPELVEELSQNYEEHLAKANEIAERVPESAIREQLAEAISTATTQHLAVLDKVQALVPEEARTEIVAVRERSIQGNQAALKVLAEENPEKAMELVLQVAESRIDLVQQAAESQDENKAEEATREYEKYAPFGEEISYIAQQAGKDPAKVQELVARANALHVTVLKEVEQKVPEQARPAIERAVEKAQLARESAIKALEGRPPAAPVARRGGGGGGGGGGAGGGSAASSTTPSTTISGILSTALSKATIELTSFPVSGIVTDKNTGKIYCNGTPCIFEIPYPASEPLILLVSASGYKVWEGSFSALYPTRLIRQAILEPLSLINATNVTAARCSDTDGGVNPYRKGTIINRSGSFTDYCSSANMVLLYEQDCTRQEIPYFCPDGCAAGACINQTKAIVNVTNVTLPTCGNNYCDFYENISSCAQDCTFASATCSQGVIPSTGCTCNRGTREGPLMEYSGYCCWGSYSRTPCATTLQACTDSDGGMNTNIKGTGSGNYAGSTTKAYMTYEDHCVNSIQLNEAFCDSSTGYLSAIGLMCQYGCSDGVCLPAPVINITPNLTTNISTNLSINITVNATTNFTTNITKNITNVTTIINVTNVTTIINVTNVTKNVSNITKVTNITNRTLTNITNQTLTKVTANITTSCRDTDGGINYYNKGYVYDPINGNAVDNCPWELGGTRNKTALNEWYCAGTGLAKVVYNCAGGCSEGKCLVTNSCTDTDGGINYTVTGSVSGIEEDRRYEYADSCDSSLAKEWYCQGTSKALTSTICALGCSHGSCLSPSVTTNITANVTTNITANVTTVNVTMATLSVITNVLGAAVSNINTGYVYCTATPCTVSVVVPPNSINIKITKTGYLDWSNVIYLYAGQTTNVYAALTAVKTTNVTANATNATIASCTNTDGGIDYYTKGYVYDPINGNAVDNCPWELGGTLNKFILNEWYCSGTSRAKIVYTCSSECSRGRCPLPANLTFINVTITNITTTTTNVTTTNLTATNVSTTTNLTTTTANVTTNVTTTTNETEPTTTNLTTPLPAETTVANETTTTTTVETTTSENVTVTETPLPTVETTTTTTEPAPTTTEIPTIDNAPTTEPVTTTDATTTETTTSTTEPTTIIETTTESEPATTESTTTTTTESASTSSEFIPEVTALLSNGYIRVGPGITPSSLLYPIDLFAEKTGLALLQSHYEKILRIADLTQERLAETLILLRQGKAGAAQLAARQCQQDLELFRSSIQALQEKDLRQIQRQSIEAHCITPEILGQMQNSR